MTQLPYTFLEKNCIYIYTHTYFTESEIVKFKTLSKINHGFTIIFFIFQILKGRNRTLSS